MVHRALLNIQTIKVMNLFLFNDIVNRTNRFIHCLSKQSKWNCFANFIFNDLLHVSGNMVKRKPKNLKMFPSNMREFTYPPIIKSLANFFSFCLSFILCISKWFLKLKSTSNSRLENDPQSRTADNNEHKILTNYWQSLLDSMSVSLYRYV